MSSLAEVRDKYLPEIEITDDLIADIEKEYKFVNNYHLLHSSNPHLNHCKNDPKYAKFTLAQWLSLMVKLERLVDKATKIKTIEDSMDKYFPEIPSSREIMIEYQFMMTKVDQVEKNEQLREELKEKLLRIDEVKEELTNLRKEIQDAND